MTHTSVHRNWRWLLGGLLVLASLLFAGPANAAGNAPLCSDLSPDDTEVGETSFIGGCFDDEGDNVHITITQQPTKGTATVLGQDTPNPSVQYTASQTGSDTIKFKGNDGSAD